MAAGTAAPATAWHATSRSAASATGASPRSSPRQRSSMPSRAASPEADERAARVEATARRDPRRVGRLAAEDLRRDVRDLRHDRQQRARVGVPRRGEDVLGRALLDDPPQVHHRHAVGDVPRQPEVVGDDEDRHLGLAHQAQHQREDLAAHRRVEARHRLVGDEQARAQDHRPGDDHPLALAAGDLVGVAGEEALGRAQAGARERLGHELLLVAGHALDAQRPRPPPRRSSGAR